MGPNYSLIAIAVPLLFLLVGLVLFVVGWRGRVVGTQPVCRKCGFDLTGLPETSGACPECGSDLKRLGAMRRGQRVRRRGRLWTGALLLFMGLAGGGIVGTALMRDVDLNPYKPLGMLVREVGNSDPLVSQPAMREISRRMSAGQLSDQQIKTLADTALVLQGDRKRPWVEGWGDFIDATRANGKLSDAAWLRYLRQAPDLSLEAPPVQSRVPTALSYWIVLGPARVGNNTRLRHRVNSRDIAVRVNDMLLPPEQGAWSTSGGLSASAMAKSGHSALLVTVLDKLKDGKQTLRITGTLDILDAGAQWDAPALLSIPFDLSADWTLESGGDSPAPR